MRRFGPMLLGLALLASCEDEVTPPAEPPPPLTEEPHIELEGCAQRTETECWRPSSPQAQCERGPTADEPLRVWSEHPLEVHVDGGAALPRTRRGAGFVWSVPPGKHEVELRHGSRIVRTLTVHAALPEPPALQRAREDGTGGELEPLLEGFEPRARLAALDLVMDASFVELRGLSPDGRTQFVSEIERRSELAYDLAVRVGDTDQAACHARRALHLSLFRPHEAELVSTWVTRLEMTPRVSLATMARNAYYLGLVAQRYGELQRALDSFETVDRIYRQLDAPSDPILRSAREKRAVLLADLGQPTRALRLMEDTVGPSVSCANWLAERSNQHWVSMMLEEYGTEVDDPTPEFEDILTLMADSPDCYDVRVHEHVLLNLGAAHARRGRVVQALLAFDEAAATGDAGEDEFSWVERLRLAQRAQIPPPPAPPAPDHALDQWRRAYWEGRLYEQLGKKKKAIASYRVAEGVLTRLAGGLRFDNGREAALMRRKPSSARLVRLLLENERSEEALCVARLARNRSDLMLARTEQLAALPPPRLARWRSARDRVDQIEREVSLVRRRQRLLPLDERASLAHELSQAERKLDDAAVSALDVLYGSDTRPAASCDDLATPRPNELALLLFPIDAAQRQWAIFAFDRTSTDGVVLDLEVTAPSGLAKLLNTRFVARVRNAERIRILPTAKSWSIPFASLPWQGSPLLMHAPLILSLDIPTSVPADTPARRAVVIGDPNQDLEHARSEALMVSTTLEKSGWSATTLLGPEATATRLQEEVSNIALLHFAGHANKSGPRGWESGMRLGRSEQLKARDILALENPPTVAVLPACEVVASSEGTLGGGMSVARGLLLSGTTVVVGGTRKLDDDVARRVSGFFYTEGIPTTAEEAASSLRAALLRANEEAPTPAVLDAFVVLAP